MRRQKEFWDYDGKTKKPVRSPSGAGHLGRNRQSAADGRVPVGHAPSPGSRLIQALIAACAFLSAATIVISLLFYYYPAQTVAAANAAASHVSFALKYVQENLPKKRTVVDLTSKLADTTSQIPPLIYTEQQGDIMQIGEQGADADGEFHAMLNTAIGPMLYYSQGDARWRDYLYGGTDPLRRYGCGPVVAAMLVNALARPVTPVEMADWCAANGFYAPQSGSYHSIIPDTMAAFGIPVQSVEDRSFESASGLLRSGHVLVALMGKGALTNGGHFIIITEALENGNVHIADPNSFENSAKEWDLRQILNELKHAEDDGGPLWAVGLP